MPLQHRCHVMYIHYTDVIMSVMGSQITSLTIVYSTVYSGADQRKHQSSASLSFVWGIHRGLVNSPHKGPVVRKMFPFDDVIMLFSSWDLKEFRWVQNQFSSNLYLGGLILKETVSLFTFCTYIINPSLVLQFKIWTNATDLWHFMVFNNIAQSMKVTKV